MAASGEWKNARDWACRCHSPQPRAWGSSAVDLRTHATRCGDPRPAHPPPKRAIESENCPVSVSGHRYTPSTAHSPSFVYTSISHSITSTHTHPHTLTYNHTLTLLRRWPTNTHLHSPPDYTKTTFPTKSFVPLLITDITCYYPSDGLYRHPTTLTEFSCAT